MTSVKSPMVGFGSPLDDENVRRFADAVNHVGLNLPTPFYTELIGEPKNNLINQANLLVNMWENKPSDSRTRELMMHLVMTLKVDGKDADAKVAALKDMISNTYKVKIGSSDVLASATRDILENKSNRAQAALNI